MTDIGTFRTVDVRDLARFTYGGNEAAMHYDLGELRVQGLVDEKTIPQAHKEPRNVVALTERGHRILRKASGLRKDQAIYHGYVKAREINHDADLYKVYQEAAEEIRERRGKPVRVRLDFELKAKIQRAIYHERKANPERDLQEIRQQVADEIKLPVVDGQIQIPDARIEYELDQGARTAFSDIEIATAAYRPGHLRAKA